MERWESDFDRSDGEDVGGSGGVRVGQLIARLHTGHDDGTGGHGVTRRKGVRHPLPQVSNKLFENATSKLICFARSRLVALGQGGIGPLLFHIVYVKQNIEKLWNFTPPPPPP